MNAAQEFDGFEFNAVADENQHARHEREDGHHHRRRRVADQHRNTPWRMSQMASTAIPPLQCRRQPSTPPSRQSIPWPRCQLKRAGKDARRDDGPATGNCFRSAWGRVSWNRKSLRKTHMRSCASARLDFTVWRWPSDRTEIAQVIMRPARLTLAQPRRNIGRDDWRAIDRAVEKACR